MKKLLSIVAPVYFEEDVIGEFYSRLKEVLVELESRFRHEIIFVNDGSTDRSMPILKDLAKKDPSVKLIDLSRNFGHQIAISCGIENTKGDAVVVIDSDLQDPPQVIVDMVEKWEEGCQVVYAVRRKREGETFIKLATANLYYKLIDSLSNTKLPRNAGDFRLMDRVVVDALNSIHEENRYIRGLVTWIGFSQCPVEYDRDKRYAGETKFTMTKMLKFAFDGITSFSEKPLQVSMHLGLLVTFISFVYIVWIIIGQFINPENLVQGWSTTLVAILFLGGVQLFSIGILGEYVGRIYVETKRRPLYLTREKVGFDEEGDS